VDKKKPVKNHLTHCQCIHWIDISNRSRNFDSELFHGHCFTFSQHPIPVSIRKYSSARLHLFASFFFEVLQTEEWERTTSVYAVWYPPLFSASLSARWHRWLRHSAIESRSLVKLAFEQPDNSVIANSPCRSLDRPVVLRLCLLLRERVFDSDKKIPTEAAVRLLDDDRANTNVIHDRSSSYRSLERDLRSWHERVKPIGTPAWNTSSARYARWRGEMGTFV